MSDNLAGKTLKEHYYLEKRLDSGGFGTIYLARDTFSAIGGTYVVKHFSPIYDNQAQLETAMRLFQQESDTLQKLGNHPQIPRIYDFFEEESHFFLVQEFIEGKTIEQELTEIDYFDRDRAIKFLSQTLEVLEFIHEAGYIHRDIKPSNLIRNRFDNRIFLIDFGAVKEKINPQNIGKEGQFTRTVGILSPGYTPDEQFHGKPEYCSDIYALGMVVIQAMTGKHPNKLYRNVNLELMWRDLLPPHINYDLNFLDLIDKMVEQQWQKRYQSATAILEALNLIYLAQNTEISTSFTNQKPTSIQEENSSISTENSPVIPDKNKLDKFKMLAGLGILSAIAIPSWLYLSSFRQGDFITYENEHIKVEYPAGWSRENRSNFLNNTMVFISPKESESDEFQERVAIIVEESSRPLSLTEYSNQAVNQIEKLANFILSPPRPTTLGRSDGKYVIYQGMDLDKKVKRQEVWTVNYKEIYTIIYTAEPDKFDKFLPKAEKMIESLEILN
ncbi:serine/threonine protein kinase [Waterburya agarophytonicola K14]|uniref:Serine/threonine protein kinase n=1 Tax=Waterburya agarophytonicola KI4 TaxID=2874699 RepID=A0A964BPC3_9CYAN|nr:serine/threonine-protein kinase [Waterburya agarophytonicola]MCC0176799.1 serine/threonine protein kinase [Waterburya agarophytonicola KI4]